MLTPLEIENIKFKRKPLGYSEDEVDEFISKLLDDYEKVYRDNIELKDKIASLNDGLRHYKNIEETLQNTLVLAQNTAEDVKKNAYNRSEIIMKEAEAKATQMIAEANQEITKLTFRQEELRRNFSVIKAKIESLLYAQIELMKDASLKVEELS